MLKLRYFKPSEFVCKCGKCGLGMADIDPFLLETLDNIRHELKRPIFLTSAVRCEAHNKAVGGKEHSEHMKHTTHNGLACGVDIKTDNVYTLYELIKLLYKYDIRRIGYNPAKNFLHIGTSQADVHPQNVFFKY